MPPERIFVERQKVEPGFVPPAQQQSVWAPLISGIGAGASALAGMNFGGSSTPKIGTNINYFS